MVTLVLLYIKAIQSIVELIWASLIQILQLSAYAYHQGLKNLICGNLMCCQTCCAVEQPKGNVNVSPVHGCSRGKLAASYGTVYIDNIHETG